MLTTVTCIILPLFFRPLCACFYTRRFVTLTFIPSSLLTLSNHFRLNQSWIRRWVGSVCTVGGDCEMLSSFHKIYRKILVGHFRVQKTSFQNEAKCNTFFVKMGFICTGIKNHFQINSFALSLASKQRLGLTRKWPIVTQVLWEDFECIESGGKLQTFSKCRCNTCNVP